MSCRVCGHSVAEFRPRSGLVLCQACHADTPAKVGRQEFDRRYWGADLLQVPEATRREFYSDYLHSACTLDRYIAETSCPAD